MGDSVNEVDWIGHVCAAGYGVVIPCFLALLFAKQHLTMRRCKTFFAYSDNKEEVTLQLQVLSAAESLEDGLVVAATMKLKFTYETILVDVVGILWKKPDVFSYSPNRNCWGSQFILQRVDGQDDLGT